MPVDASIVFAPRFTTLIGAKEFETLPIDVSGFTGAQFQVWRGPIRTTTPGGEQFSVEFEESLDTETWVLGPSTPQPFVITENDVHFFSYNFRLRWFRLKMTLAGVGPMVSMWAEGLLRGGGGGAWPTPGGATAAPAGSSMANLTLGGGNVGSIVSPPMPRVAMLLGAGKGGSLLGGLGGGGGLPPPGGKG